jgi:hypothetical protein
VVIAGSFAGNISTRRQLVEEAVIRYIAPALKSLSIVLLR